MVMARYEVCPRCTNACVITYYVEFDRIIKIKDNMCPKGEEYIREKGAIPDSICSATVFVRNGIVSKAEVRTAKPVPGPRVAEVEKALKTLEVDAPLEFGKVVVENFLDTGIDLISRVSIAKYK